MIMSFNAFWNRVTIKILLSLFSEIITINVYFIFSFFFCEIQLFSGVATLSITDSSATSSEDASNPDSPDNPALNSDLLLHLNGPKCSKQHQQVPNNNNNSNHTKNKQVLLKINIYTHPKKKKWNRKLTSYRLFLFFWRKHRKTTKNINEFTFMCIFLTGNGIKCAAFSMAMECQFANSNSSGGINKWHNSNNNSIRINKCFATIDIIKIINSKRK